MIYKNGDIKLCWYKNDLSTGKSRYIWKDGTSLEGYLTNHMISGIASKILSRGQKYFGQRKDDKKHGFGIYMFQ